MKRSPVQQCVIPVLLVICLLIAGCRPSSQEAGRAAGRRGGVISVRLTALPGTFNPLMVTDESSLLVGLWLLGSRLVSFDHSTQKYVPALAENWKTEPDGRTVTVTLRDGLKFSDGQALTAADVLFTLQALYDERTGSPLLRDAMLIGGKQIVAAATDSRQLKLTFPERTAAPESFLVNLPVLPRHALGQAFSEGRLGSAWPLTAEPRQIVTSGPFTVESVQPGASIRLSRNPYYWRTDSKGVQLPYADALVLEGISDPNNTFLRLNQGTLDLADRIRPADFAALQTAAGAVRAADAGPGLSTDHLWFNLSGQAALSPMKRAWFGEVRFRRAISHAIDRQAIAKATLRGLATPLEGFVSPGNRAWAAADLPRTDYSPERAQALLQEAGFVRRGSADAPELYDHAGNRVEFTLLVQAQNEPRKQMATVIQQDLARLGISLQVATLDTQAVTERWTKTFDYDAVLMGLTLTDPEPSSYTSFLRSDSATHQWSPRQKNPATDWEARIDQLIELQAAESDPQKRQALFREIQVIMAEQLPVIPLVARHIVSAASARLGNWQPSSIFPYSLWNADELFISEPAAGK